MLDQLVQGAPSHHLWQVTPRGNVVGDILTERKRQDEKWGAQTDNADTLWATILGEEFGEVCQATLDNTNLREELIHTAAVAIAWIEALDVRAVR